MGGHSGQASMQASSVKSMIGFDTEPGTVESGQFSWQIVPREREYCSNQKENCMATKCCDIAGYYCYEKNDTFAQCAKTCSPSANNLCRPASETLQLEPDYSTPKRSLFCFSVYTENTGSPKPSYELDLLTGQYAKKVSIFACDKYEVYGDVEVSLGGGFSTKKVTDVEGDWHFAKRKETGAWVNTGMFTQVWKAIATGWKASSADWVLKVDADAV